MPKQPMIYNIYKTRSAEEYELIIRNLQANITKIRQAGNQMFYEQVSQNDVSETALDQWEIATNQNVKTN